MHAIVFSFWLRAIPKTDGLRVMGGNGILILLQFKTNLNQTILTNRLSNGYFQIQGLFTNPDPRRFYRAVVVP